jgi:hypothetical protein
MWKTLFKSLQNQKSNSESPPFKAPQMDAPVQYTVLAEIPATNPADAHSTKEIWPASTAAPLSRPSLVSYKLLYNSHYIASSCTAKIPWSAPAVAPPGVAFWGSLAPRYRPN